MGCGCSLRKRINKSNLILSNRDVYLDYCATTKPDLEVLAAIDKVNRIYWGNPSAQNSRGITLFNDIEKRVALLKSRFDDQNSDIFFDSSSTSIIKKIKNYSDYSIISSNIEHNSLLECADVQVPVDNLGQINTDILINTIKTCKKPLLVYSPVNHETGNTQNISQLFGIANNFKCPVILDLVQTVSRIPHNDWFNFCDGFYFSGHKIHGVQGAALLYLKRQIIDFNRSNSPIPFSLYDGTINSSGVIGLLVATELLFDNFFNDYNTVKTLHNDALTILESIKCNKNFESANNSYGIINISFDFIEKIEDLLLYLNSEGIQTGRISACSGDVNRESTVLSSMNRGTKRSKTSIRLSFGKYSKRDDFYRFSSAINNFVSSLN